MPDNDTNHGEDHDSDLEATDGAPEPAPTEASESDSVPTSTNIGEFEETVNLAGDSPFFQQLQERLGRPVDEPAASDGESVTRSHLKGLLEALVFASDHPQKAGDLAKAASANIKEVRDLLTELKTDYQSHGIQLDEVAGGWIFRTSSAYAPFVRDLTKQKPVRLSRAQVETLAILAYRQPITRPEVDDIRGVDSGPVLKLLLERDLVRILGKKDEPGRPLLYGTTTAFLEFFGLKSLKDLPTLREFTELTEDSRRVAERELGEVLDRAQPEDEVAASASSETAPGSSEVSDTLPPEAIQPEAPSDAGDTEPEPSDQSPAGSS